MVFFSNLSDFLENDPFIILNSIFVNFVSNSRNPSILFSLFWFEYLFNSEILSYISCADISINLFILGAPIITTWFP